MTSRSGRVVVLRRTVQGQVSADDFAVEERAVDEVAPGEVLVRSLFLSLDPVMRMRMLDGDPSAVGEVVGGRIVGVVEESDDPRFAEGALVLGWGGWRELSTASADFLQPIDPAIGAPELWLGLLGRPGITAWLGMTQVAEVASDDTVVVSSAAGAVGSVAAQVARARGARVIGIGGGPEKCGWLTGSLRLAGAVDHSAPDFAEQLTAASPDGVSVVFENVGARILDASLERLRPGGRVALCGLLERYQGGDPYAYRNFHLLLERGIRLTGFRIDDYTALHASAVRELGELVARGELVSEATVSNGIESAPEAFVRMLSGIGRGKHLIRVGSD